MLEARCSQDESRYVLCRAGGRRFGEFVLLRLVMPIAESVEQGMLAIRRLWLLVCGALGRLEEDTFREWSWCSGLG